MTDLQEALHETNEHAGFYIKAKSYMEGRVEEKFANPRFSQLLRGSANRFRVNYARVPVDTVLDHVKIAGIGSSSEAGTTLIQRVWDDNAMGNVYSEVHDKAGSSGSSYLMVWPSHDVDNAVDVSMCDPENTRIFYSPENPRRKMFASRVWKEGKRTRVNLYYTDRIEKYISRPSAKGLNAEAFDPFVELVDEAGEDVWPIANPYGVIPIFHFRTASEYGRPLNADAWEPQDAINKLMATMMASVDYQGFPQRYILQKPNRNPEDDGADDWDTDADDYDETGAGATSVDREDRNLKAGPGGLWFLNADSVGQFDTAEPDNFIKPLDTYIKAISTTTQTPLHAFHGMGDAPSGESLRAANAPRDDKARTVQGWFDPTWREVLSFILILGNIKDDAPYVNWVPIGTGDDKEYWESVAGKIAAGVPAEVALEEAGYSKEQQAKWAPAPVATA